jgi:phytoene dehydrogenase-like protein
MGIGSPFFRSLDLSPYGLEWIQPEIPLAHPFSDGSAAVLYRSLESTAEALGRDGPAYRRLVGPLVANWRALSEDILAPLIGLPSSPLLMARFGLRAVWPVTSLVRSLFREEKTRAIFAGIAAHPMMPLDWPLTSAFGLVLAVFAHAVGWPVARGGSQSIASALAALLTSHGGEIVTDSPVTSLAQLPPARAILLDVTPRQVLQIAGDVLPSSYARHLRNYRYGSGAFKVDWALSEPIPWTAEACRRAGTIHLGDSLAEIQASERAAWQGRIVEKPYALVAQQSLFDPSRAPGTNHTGWAYCHVPHGSDVDMTEAIEAQVERYAPGFRDCIRDRHTYSAPELHHYNPNYVGGDINGGLQNWRQLATRPAPRLNPYSTPIRQLFLCSSATPPGGGVHGMCGYHAAQAVLRKIHL